QAIAQSSQLTVSSGAEVRITGGVNAFQRSTSDAAVILDGGIFDYQASTHGHMGNITLSNGATWKASAGGGYNGENMQLNGTVTVSGSSASTISNFTQGLALSGNREFNVADVTGDAAVDLTVAIELENNDSGSGDGIIKTGAGTMNLTGASTYSGGTVVNGGMLKISNALRSTSGITVSNGATLETNATNIFVGGHGAAVADTMVVTLNGSNWVMTAAHDARIGNVVLNDASTWTSNRAITNYDVLLANTTAGAATVAVTGTGASVMNGTGGIHLQGIQNFNVADTTGDAAADLSVSLVLAAQGTIGGAAGGINKLGSGTMAISRQTTYTGGTTVAAGVLDLTGGGGSGGTIRGTATVNAGATLRLSTGDATGYATNDTRLAVINLDGGTLEVNSTSNQTLGSAVINMTGGTISGIAGSNLDFYGGASALNTLASPDTSVIGGVALSPLRQGSTTFDVADGAAAVDLRIDSVLRNSPSGNAGGAVLIKAGDGTMELTANNTLTNGLTINGGVVAITANGLYRNGDGSAAYNTGAVVTINTGGTLRLNSYNYNGDGGLGGLRDYAGNRVINGGTLEVVGAGHSSGNDFTVGSAGGTFRYAPSNTADTLTLAGNANTNTQLNGVLDFNTVGNIAVTDSIEGSGGITKSGGGTLTLSA
ncbi:MAG: autotransporter-associated beta strand repeat-containing protein, partial [Verrucomicrobiae bacterium]|nr:autotransporter-associated beta strand repeat-containing protein [Verrucomicrobiae bacterium]